MMDLRMVCLLVCQTELLSSLRNPALPGDPCASAILGYLAIALEKYMPDSMEEAVKLGRWFARWHAQPDCPMLLSIKPLLQVIHGEDI